MGKYCGLDAATWAVRGLQLLNQDVPVAFAEAVRLGKRGGQPGNRNAAKSTEVAGNEPRNTKFVSDTAAYVVARLDRDAPELAEAVRRGEVTAHAAAVQAGFRRPTWTAPAGSVDRASPLS